MLISLLITAFIIIMKAMYKFKSKKIILITLIAIFLFCIFNINNTNFIATILPARNHNLTVVIDPGHGGYDPGKVGVNNILEKDINLSISLYLKEYLELHNYNVIMTRESDIHLYEEGCSSKKTDDLNHRIDIIEKAAPLVTISIHQNSFSDSNVCGAQVFYHEQSETSKLIADTIQESLITTLNPDKKRTSKSNSSYYLLKKTTHPTVIVECGFLSNPTECELLTTENYQMQIATAICTGLDNYVNFYQR